MAIVITSDKHYKKIGKKLKNRLGVTTGFKPSEMAQGILSLKDTVNEHTGITAGVIVTNEKATIIGGKMYCGMLAGFDAECFEVPENVAELPNYTFYGSGIKTIAFHDSVTDIGRYCFSHCENLVSLSLPESLVSIGAGAFSWIRTAESIIIPKSVTTIGSNAFGMTNFKCIDIWGSVSIPTGCFSYSGLLLETFDYLKMAVVLRNESGVCPLENTDAFSNSSISEGIGYIYVPSALLESYKTATNWSTYANQFRVLEDYTVDGTTTGEFDYSKI